MTSTLPYAFLFKLALRRPSGSLFSASEIVAPAGSPERAEGPALRRNPDINQDFQ